MAKIDDLKAILQEVRDRFETIKKEAGEEIVIDDFDLDGESLRTPRLHSRWLSVLSDEGIKLKQLQGIQKKLFLERWKYYQGKATDKYYAEHGQVHDKIMKTDLDIYLGADDMLCVMKEIMEVQGEVVNFLERTVKEISSRTFHIKSAIDWRRFQAGN